MELVGFLIGILGSYAYSYIQKKLKKEGVELDNTKIVLAVTIIYLVYSIVGIIALSYTDTTGRTCRWANYGMTICH